MLTLVWKPRSKAYFKAAIRSRGGGAPGSQKAQVDFFKEPIVKQNRTSFFRLANSLQSARTTARCGLDAMSTRLCLSRLLIVFTDCSRRDGVMSWLVGNITTPSAPTSAPRAFLLGFSFCLFQLPGILISGLVQQA